MDNNPKQNNKPVPNVEQEQPTQPVAPNSTPISSGPKVIQPLSNNLTPDPTPTPNPIVSAESPVEVQPQPTPQPIIVTQQPSLDSSISNPNPVTGFVAGTAPISKASIEGEETSHKKLKQLLLLLACAALVLIVGIGVFYYWYSQQDHSIYSKLTTENYAQNGITFSFEYPKVMSVYTSAEKADPGVVKSAFDYSGSNGGIAIIAPVFNYGNILSQFNITPTQELDQFKSGQGNLVTGLKQNSLTEYNDLYAGCSKWLYTNSGQKDLLCEYHNQKYGGSTIVNIIGADYDYQFLFNLSMTNSLWTAHQKVWQKIEKSFNYD